MRRGGLLVFLGCVAGLTIPPAFGAEAPASAQALSEAGVRALDSGNLAEALRDFSAAHRADPKSADVAFHLGLTYARLGRYKEAVPPLRFAVSAGKPADMAFYSLAISLYETGDFDAAAAQLERLHRRNWQHPDEVLYLLEESYRRGKRPREANECYLELAHKYPGSAYLGKLMGFAYGERGEDDRALAEFQRVLVKSPSISEVHRAIGILYLNRNDPAEATRWFQEELRLNSCDAASHYYLGEIARKDGQLTEAAAEYKKAIGCDPVAADGHLGMGMFLEAEHRKTQALTEFREAVRLRPDSIQAHYELALCLQRDGRTKVAAIEMETVKRLTAIENAKAAATLASGR